MYGAITTMRLTKLNHVIHNIEQEIAVFEPVDLSSHSKATIVCGNGPSLDAHLNIIKNIVTN